MEDQRVLQDNQKRIHDKIHLCQHPAHMEAHFLVCFVALMLMHVLEHMTNRKHPIKQIRHALCSYSSCPHIDQHYYLFDYRDNILKTLQKTFGGNLSKILSLSEIK